MKQQLAVVMTELHQMIDNTTFKEEHRLSEKKFVRNRKLSFSNIILLTISGLKRGIVYGISSFLNELNSEVERYSAAAFCKARKNISPTAFRELFRFLASSFYKKCDNYKTYKGYRIFSIDGTDINLPNNEETFAVFGSENYAHGKQAQALCSCLYDSLNNVIVDSIVDRFDANERVMAIEHIDYMKTAGLADNTIVLMDRGYPSFALMKHFDDNGIKYIMRSNRQNFFREVRDAQGSDSIATRTEKNETIKFRVIRIDSEKREYTYLTNLFDETFTLQDFQEIYHLRWAIETNYADLKTRFELENFSSSSPICIMQDIYATMFLINMLAYIELDCEDEIRKYNSSAERKCQYKINRSNAIRNLRDSVVKILLEPQHKVKRLLKKLQKQIAAEVIPVRKNRHFKRSKRKLAIKYPPNRKS